MVKCLANSDHSLLKIIIKLFISFKKYFSSDIFKTSAFPLEMRMGHTQSFTFFIFQFQTGVNDFILFSVQVNAENVYATVMQQPVIHLLWDAAHVNIILWGITAIFVYQVSKYIQFLTIKSVNSYFFHRIINRFPRIQNVQSYDCTFLYSKKAGYNTMLDIVFSYG